MSSPQLNRLDTLGLDGNLQEKYDYLTKKYQELKNQKHKLFEHIQKKEKEHQQELENFQQKLEQNKLIIRKLEDENLELRFTVSDLKIKETQYLEQIDEIKSLLRKYYLKAKQNELRVNTQGSPETSFCGQSENIVLTVPDFPRRKCPLPRNDKRDGVVSAHLFANSEKESSAIITSHLHKPKLGNLNTSFDAKDNNKNFLEVKDSFGHNVDDPRRRRSYLEDDMNNENRKVHPRGKSTFLPERFHFDEQDNLRKPRDLKKRKESKRYSSPENEDSPKRKKSKVYTDWDLDQIRGRSTSLTLLNGKDYLFAFNTLSQNIVSLGVKPEIEVGCIEEVIENTPQKENIESQKKPPVLRYVAKDPPDHPEINRFTPKKLNFDHIEQIHNNKKLFEDFLVVGIDKEDLKNYATQHPDKKAAKLKPKILFKYPEKAHSIHGPAYNSIPDFVFPFGVQSYKLKSSPSFSALNPIIYISGGGDQRAKCFVLPLLSGNVEDKTVEMGEIIEQSNPNHLLYIVCVAFKDFITLSETTKPKKSLKDVKYWEVTKVMCFMTYYPLAGFFFDVLTKLLDILKVERMMQISQANAQDLGRHEVVDAQFTNKYLDALVKKHLDEILAVQTINFSSRYNFKFHGNFMEAKISLEIQDREAAYSMESDWAYCTVFSYLTLKDLLWLFAALMLEKKLVFLSKNLYLLTSTLSVLHSLMKPFKYPFPLIFNLPEVIMVICDAPGAALIGINQSEEYIKTDGLLNDYPSCIFVCLDEEKIYMEHDGHHEIPSLESLEKSLLIGTLMDAKKPSNRPHVTKSIKYTGNIEEQKKCLEIIKTFRKKIQEKIIDHIPEVPIYEHKKNLDFEKIGSKILEATANVDKPFLKHFVKTQIFTYFIERHYETIATYN